MYRETIDSLQAMTALKLLLLQRSPGAFFVSAMLAGAYVGVGILLIFILGEDVPGAWRKLVMGASFGIALTLVVIAGAELFTGYPMYLALGAADRRVRLVPSLASLGLSWSGNLLGATALVGLFALGGGADLLGRPDTLLQKVAAYKMNSPALALLARAALCNWLVCLALWMAVRVRDDAAKCIVIFWCLFAFIASGFEHSVANMTLLGAALAGNHPEAVTWGGYVHNLFWVTLGNLIGGGVFVGLAYGIITRGAERQEVAPVEHAAQQP